MTEPTPAPHPAVAAILVVTPMIKDWSGTPCIRPVDAEPIAARQAAAVLRWMAANCPCTNEDGGTEDGVWFEDQLRDLADAIEGADHA